MASNLPEFRNRDTEGDVNYTTYFENSRRGLRDIHSMISKQEAEALKRGEQKISQEDGEPRRPVDSPSHHNERHRASGDSTCQQPPVESSDASKRTARTNAAGFRSADHSPLHPHYQAKIGNKGSAISSPSGEKKGSHEGTPGLASSTPGISPLRSVPDGSETPDGGASVSNFNRAKEERHGSGGNASGMASDANRPSGQGDHSGENTKSCWRSCCCCCFPRDGN